MEEAGLGSWEAERVGGRGRGERGGEEGWLGALQAQRAGKGQEQGWGEGGEDRLGPYSPKERGFRGPDEPATRSPRALRRPTPNQARDKLEQT